MKYVIELPEYVKQEVDIEDDVDKAEDFVKWHSATLTLAIKDSTPLQEELEEIKTEMIKNYWRGEEIFDETQEAFNQGVSKSILVLDNHIKELSNDV